METSRTSLDNDDFDPITGIINGVSLGLNVWGLVIFLIWLIQRAF